MKNNKKRLLIIFYMPIITEAENIKLVMRELLSFITPDR